MKLLGIVLVLASSLFTLNLTVILKFCSTMVPILTFKNMAVMANKEQEASPRLFRTAAVHISFDVRCFYLCCTQVLISDHCSRPEVF